MELVIQVDLPPVLDLTVESPEYEAGAPTTQQ
jgi:hypothetical protein